MGASALSGREQGPFRVAADGAAGAGFAAGGRTELVPGTGEAAARRTLRAQIARLEHELADAFVTAFPMGGLPQPAVMASTSSAPPPPPPATPRGGGRAGG